MSIFKREKTEKRAPQPPATGLYKVIYHGSIQARPANDDAELAFAELTSKAAQFEHKKIVIRCSLFGFQAKWWPSGQYVIDLNCANLRLVSIGGRSVTLVFKDPGTPRSSSLSAQHHMYAFYCESEAIAFEIASSMLQIARTLTAAIREIKYAGSIDHIAPRNNDREVFVTNYQPEVELDAAQPPNYGTASKPEATIHDLISRQPVSLTSAIESLTDKTFLPTLKNYDMALVIFLLPDNPYCRVVEGQLERATPKLLTCHPSVHVCKVNLLTDSKHARKLGITTQLVPVMAIYRYGKAGPYNGPDDSAGILAYMKAHQRSEEQFDEDDYITMGDQAEPVVTVDSDTRHLRTSVEDEALRQMLHQISAADVEAGVHSSMFNNQRSEQGIHKWRRIQYGQAQPSRGFVRSLAMSIRLGVENSDIVILPEVCENNFFDQIKSQQTWSPQQQQQQQSQRGGNNSSTRDMVMNTQLPRATAWDSPMPALKDSELNFPDTYVDADGFEPGLQGSERQPQRWSNNDENRQPYVI